MKKHVVSKLVVEHCVLSEAEHEQRGSEDPADDATANTVRRIRYLKGLAMAKELPIGHGQGDTVEAMHKQKRRRRSLSATDSQAIREWGMALAEDTEMR